MIFVLAPDSFKESMSAEEACIAMEKAIKKVRPSAECIHVPMADGGEGTVQSLVTATKGELYSLNVVGPLGEEVQAEYGILGDGRVAIVEMASASGLHHVPFAKRNPLLTTTYGTGQLIQACLEHQVETILIGIGGSATNDGGIGAIQALGGKFMDQDGKELLFGGGGLSELHSIDVTGIDQRLHNVKIEIACDVNNPLCGENGASAVYGPQKGATEQMIQRLDESLYHYGKVIEKQYNQKIIDVPGAGAAGGLGAGLMMFLNGTLRSGIDLVIEYTKLEEQIKQADFVFTGEGGIDFQTKFGKTPHGVSVLAKKYDKPTIAFAGRIGEGIESLYESIDAIFSITNGAETLESALVKGTENLQLTTENVTRLLLMNTKNK